MWSGLFIPDPGSGCWLSTHPGSRIPDPGVKKAPDPGSGSATLNVKLFYCIKKWCASFDCRVSRVAVAPGVGFKIYWKINDTGEKPFPSQYRTVIRFLWISAKFGTCTVVSVNGTLVEDKMRRFKGECAHFSFNKCLIYTHDSASSKLAPTHRKRTTVRTKS